MPVVVSEEETASVCVMRYRRTLNTVWLPVFVWIGVKELNAVSENMLVFLYYFSRCFLYWTNFIILQLPFILFRGSGIGNTISSYDYHSSY